MLENDKTKLNRKCITPLTEKNNSTIVSHGHRWPVLNNL